MRYVRLGDTGLTVPVLILGCGNFNGIGSAPELFGKGENEPEAFAVMDRARELGITMFDTANSYGGGYSEEWVGRWMAERGTREEIIVTTKVGNRVGDQPGDFGLSRRHIVEQVEKSLRRLRTDRVDLYLTHAPDPSTPVAETVGAFGELVRVGKIRHYGLSNFSTEEIERAIAAADELGVARPANVQDLFNLLDPTSSAGVLEVCARRGVGFTAYSPLAGGWLTGKYRAGRPFPEGSRMTLMPGEYAHLTAESTFRALERLQSHAASLGLSLPTMALAWALGEPAVTGLVAGPRSPEQLTRMSEAADISLPPADRAEITAIAAISATGR
jgi:aryl-alcohol dehydrogenase-like predicted oxidoreductase